MRQIAIILFLLAAGLPGFAQTPKPASATPDFSGKWTLDKSRSTVGSDVTDHLLTIEHREPQIIFSTRYNRKKREINEQLVYYTDGRPGYDPRQSPGDPAPRTFWQGRKLVRILLTQPRGPMGFQFETREEWVLSADQQTLTRATETHGRSTIRGSRAVFVRVP